MFATPCRFLASTLLASTLLAVPLGITGCASSSSSTAKTADPSMDLAEVVEFEEVLTMAHSGMNDAGTMLITSADDMGSLSEDLATMLDGVDVDEHDLVVVSLGEQPTAGYAVEVVRVAKKGDTLLVGFVPKQPQGDVTQAITQPAVVLQVEKTGATKVKGMVVEMPAEEAAE